MQTRELHPIQFLSFPVNQKSHKGTMLIYSFYHSLNYWSNIFRRDDEKAWDPKKEWQRREGSGSIIVRSSPHPIIARKGPFFSCCCEKGGKAFLSVIARSTLFFCHCKEHRKALFLCYCEECPPLFVIARSEATWQSHSVVSSRSVVLPMFVIARKGGALTKQSLFFRTFGKSIRLALSYRRLPRALSGPRNDSRGGRHCEEYSKPHETFTRDKREKPPSLLHFKSFYKFI